MTLVLLLIDLSLESCIFSTKFSDFILGKMATFKPSSPLKDQFDDWQAKQDDLEEVSPRCLPTTLTLIASYFKHVWSLWVT